MSIGAALSQRVGCLVLAGSDFPDSVADTLRNWDITLLIASDAARLSTRGLLEYQGDNFNGESPQQHPGSPLEGSADNFGFVEKIFAYTTSPLQPTPTDLQGSPLLQSTAFHFLASPEKLDAFVSELAELRTANGISRQPLLVWEPAPPSCISASRDAHLRTAKLVDVYSPNHLEFLATFQPNDKSVPLDFNRAIIEELTQQVLRSGVGENGDGVIVIRCGEHGNLVASRSYPIRWFPAFHDKASSRVVDATGAGNAFLGGFTVRFGETADCYEATIAGAVAASFAIEQVGSPHRSWQDGKELWNGEEFSSRVQQYRAMVTDTKA